MYNRNHLLRKYHSDLSILILIAVFIFLVFNFNALEPFIYEFFDVSLGQIGSFDIRKLTGQTLVVAAWGSFFSLIVGIALGLFCLTEIGSEFKVIIEKISTLVRAFPQIAMLRFVVPLLGLGVWPTVVALTAHGILPIISAVISGIENIDKDYIKVATALGMNKSNIVWKIQIPMALPVIISGLRIAIISCISGATLATYSGAEGLGILLSAGQETYNVVLIMECAVLVGLLSLIVDKTLRKIEQQFSYA